MKTQTTLHLGVVVAGVFAVGCATSTQLMQSSKSSPAAEGTVKAVEGDNGNTALTIKVKHLARSGVRIRGAGPLTEVSAQAPDQKRESSCTRLSTPTFRRRLETCDSAVRGEMARRSAMSDFAGLAVELSGHRLRLSGAVPPDSIFWVSQELGFLGAGAELDAPDRQRAGEVRALFVEQANDGSVRVRSSRPLTP